MVLDVKLREKNEKENRKRFRPDDDEEEETYLYDVRKPAEFINESAGGVFDIKHQTGINTQKNVFDKSSIFNP